MGNNKKIGQGRLPVCYILSYYSPNYVRTRTLVKALQEIDSIKLYQARNTATGTWRYLQTLWKLIIIRLRYDPKLYILGFRGYEIYWIVRLLTLGRTLAYDHMMSPYDSLVNERKRIYSQGLVARLVFHYEKAILHNADIILTDTDIHQSFFQTLFDLPPSKILAIPVGADEDVFHETELLHTPDLDAPFEVLFYGSFLPLHGMDIILKAASILRDYPIHFTLVGGNKTERLKIAQLIKQFDLDNVTHLDWVEFESLPELISRADIGLGGPFGNTGQAQRVITGKTFQFLAMAKPVIVGKIDGERGLADKINSLVIPQGDEKALSDAILWAFQHRMELEQIGRLGYDLYKTCYSVNYISKKIKKEVLS